MISVIIPTKNRSKDLEKVLPSYLAQKPVSEIILVDDSAAPLKRHPLPRVFIVEGKKRGLSAARNQGIHMAKNPFLFFGEDDLELEPNHLATLLSHLKGHRADLIEGRKIWRNEGESKEAAWRRAERFQGPLWNPFTIEFYCDRPVSQDTPTPLLLSHFLARREVFEKVMFDEDYVGFRRGFAWREETDFILRAGTFGFSILFCPHAVSFHVPTSGGGMHEFSYWQKEYWILRNHLFLLERHKNFIREKLQNRWPIPILLVTYGLHRFYHQARSHLYKLKSALSL